MMQTPLLLVDMLKRAETYYAHKKEKKAMTKDRLMCFLASQFAKWWLPDDIVFLKEIPKTSVGKFLKANLRKNLEEFYPQMSVK